MHSGEALPERDRPRWAWISSSLYGAACVLAVVLEPTNFLVVGLTLAILYHFVLCQAAFLEVAPSLGQPTIEDGHAVLTVYRRVSPVLVSAGLLMHLLPMESFARMVPGLLVATGAALIFAVKTITFAGTDAKA